MTPFREPIDADFDAIAAITNHYIVTTAIHFAYDPVTAEELRQMWRDDRDRYPWLVAEQDGRTIGYAKAGTWRSRTAYQWTPEVGLYLAPDACGHGLGTALYSALLDACVVRKFHSVIATITLPNPASIALHARLGFAPTGVIRDAGFKFDTWHDVGFFQKLLVTVR